MNQDFASAIAPYTNRLQSLCRLMTGNRDDAWDLRQVTLMKAFLAWERFEDGTNTFAWLARIARNEQINRTRSSYHRHLMQCTGDVERVAVCRSDALEEYSDEVSTALFQLSDRQRMVLFLSDIEQTPHYEIAAMFDMNLNNVRSTLFRARTRMALALREYGATNGYAMPERRAQRARLERKRMKGAAT